MRSRVKRALNVCLALLGYQPEQRETGFRAEALSPFLGLLKRDGFAPRHIIDVGANRGEWTRTALQTFPEARYTLVEPQEGPCCARCADRRNTSAAPPSCEPRGSGALPSPCPPAVCGTGLCANPVRADAFPLPARCAARHTCRCPSPAAGAPRLPALRHRAWCASAPGAGRSLCTAPPPRTQSYPRPAPRARRGY